MALSRTLVDFAAEIGATDAGPVCVRGGATQWHVGGDVQPATREVRSPAGIVTYEPAEMTVRLGAATTLAHLHAELAVHDQTTALAGAPGATVGGILAVGHSSVDALRHGPVRDTLLQARYVSAEGRLVTAGGPTVKNVTGFDLCRLLVGSLGTLGLLGEVTLRTRPLPEASVWASGSADPFALFDQLYRPAALLWDGTTTWVHLEGYAADVDAQLALCRRAGCAEVGAPPPLPPGRSAVTPAALRAVVARLRSGTAGASSPVVAELGTGVLHLDPGLRDVDAIAAHRPGGERPARAELVRLHQRLRDEFDPTRRLNPGRDPLVAR